MTATSLYGVDLGQGGSPIEFSEPHNTTNFNASSKSALEPQMLELATKPDTLVKLPFGAGALAPVRPGASAPRAPRDDSTAWGMPSTDEMIQNYIARHVLKLPASPTENRFDPLAARESQVQAARDRQGSLAPYDPSNPEKSEWDWDGSRAPSDGAMGVADQKDFSLRGLINRDLESSRSLGAGLYRPNSRLTGVSPEAVRARNERRVHQEEFQKILGIEAPKTAESMMESMFKPKPEATPRPNKPSYAAPAPVPSASASGSPFNLNKSVLAAPSAPLAPISPTAPLAPGQDDLSALKPAYTPPPRPVKSTFAMPKRVF